MCVSIFFKDDICKLHCKHTNIFKLVQFRNTCKRRTCFPPDNDNRKNKQHMKNSTGECKTKCYLSILRLKKQLLLEL
jgi:hypothetical protein